MKKIKLSAFIMLCALMCGCSITLPTILNNSDSDLSESGIEINSFPDTTTEPEPSIVFSQKEYSRDKLFSLCYSISSTNIKQGETIDITTTLTNESDNDFKVGFEDPKKPINIWIYKKDDIFGYEGNSTQLNSDLIKRSKIFQEETTVPLEKGVYLCYIFVDFARDIKDTEDKDNVDRNQTFPELGNCSIMIKPFEITVE